MKTEQLVALLAAGDNRAAEFRPGRHAGVAAAAGAVLAAPLMLSLLGLNPDLQTAARLPMFWIKLAFVAALGMAAAVLFVRLARPGVRLVRAPWLLAAPLLAMWLLAALQLGTAVPAERSNLIFGATWNVCPFYIALLSIPALAASLAAMRRLAPTQPRLAGAVSGLFAGTVGALVYALHCPEMAAPFLAIWYVLGMLAPALLGALLGPYVLRW